jgi:hypothetical protein
VFSSSKERLLGDVLGFLGIADNENKPPYERRLITAKQQLE